MKEKLAAIREHIRTVYRAYQRPFIIGFSGGKDSTATLQIVWEALQELPADKLSIPVYVICTDTLVETPYIIDYIDQTLKAIQNSADQSDLPITAHKLLPELDQSFWVNLIGRGYPAPSRMFRWCTERLKINPVTRFISEKVGSWGEATVVLGARRQESISRAQVLESKKRDHHGLSRHPSLPAAYVFTPIEDLSTDEVWEYLLANPCPWGQNNRDLLAMYQSASGGECPIVVDTTTPSCGNSRFGCWVCTLVTKDTTMESLVDQGEDWMQPLLDYRDMLQETQDPARKNEFRDYKRRSGHVSLKSTEAPQQGKAGGKKIIQWAAAKEDSELIIRGPYLFEWRKEFLRKLLTIQHEIRQERGDDYTLILPEELLLIRKLWREELQDWEDSVLAIHQEVTGKPLPVDGEDGVRFTIEDRNLLESICSTEGIPAQLIAKLLDEERKQQGLVRRSGITDAIDRIFGEEWRSEKQILEQFQADRQRKEEAGSCAFTN